MLETRVFFGPTPKSTREYVEWFNANHFATVEVSIATRPFDAGGSETVIIVVYRLAAVHQMEAVHVHDGDVQGR